MIHSSFNIAAAIIFTPVSSIFEKMAYLTIPKLESEEEDRIPAKSEIQILDTRFLNTPGYALEQCKNAAIDMAIIQKKRCFLPSTRLGSLIRRVRQESLSWKSWSIIMRMSWVPIW